MSEEEIINIIENFLNYNIEKYLSGNEVCAITNLLDLYQKEKEKNAELKVLIERNLMYSHNLEKDLFENCSNYVISKDKIKAKIEEIQNRRIKDEECELALHGFQREAKIDVLQELLEEEE